MIKSIKTTKTEMINLIINFFAVSAIVSMTACGGSGGLGISGSGGVGESNTAAEVANNEQSMKIKNGNFFLNSSAIVNQP